MVIKIARPCLITGSLVMSFLIPRLRNYTFNLECEWAAFSKYRFCSYKGSQGQGRYERYLVGKRRSEAVFLSHLGLPALLPEQFLALFLLGKDPSSLQIPESEGPLSLTASQTVCARAASRFSPGTVSAILISKKHTVPSNHELGETFSVS